jgi:predicted nucleotidyltransferase
MSYYSNMTLDDVRRMIQPEKDALRAKGVSALYVFGSVARGDAEPGSDVDFFFELTPDARFNLLDFVGLKDQLTEALGVGADIHMRNALHWRIRDKVLSQAVQVF